MAKPLETNGKGSNLAPVKKKYTVIIGIDPDVEASGVGFWRPEEKYLMLFQFTLWNLFHYLSMINFDETVLVRLEAGHKIRSTWHKGGNGMAKRVGANHEIGRQIEKFCKANGIDVQLIKPQGYSSVDHERFCKITGWNIKEKTNPEKRVAGLLVFGG